MNELGEAVQAQPGFSVIDSMILDCINRAKDDIGGVYADWVSRVANLGDKIQEGSVVDYTKIWPEPMAQRKSV